MTIGGMVNTQEVAGSTGVSRELIAGPRQLHLPANSVVVLDVYVPVIET